MIFIKESFNLDKIRQFMKRNGFIEQDGFLTYKGDNVGSLMFRFKNILAIYNYPGETITLQKDNEPSLFTFFLKNMRKFEVKSEIIVVETADGSKFNLYA